MKKFYFTFGSSKNYPHQGGWVEIHAKDMREAVKLFRSHYPDKDPGVLNCADYYTEEEFNNSGMAEGNRGTGCHEIIGEAIQKKILDKIVYGFNANAYACESSDRDRSNHTDGYISGLVAVLRHMTEDVDYGQWQDGDVVRAAYLKINGREVFKNGDIDCEAYREAVDSFTA